MHNPVLSPIAHASGPLTRLEEIAAALGIEAVVRAIGAGLDVYDTGPNGPLLADASAVEILVKTRSPGSYAIGEGA